MANGTATQGSELVLDEQVVRVYAKEFLASVADITDLAIYDEAGKQRWRYRAEPDGLLDSYKEKLQAIDLTQALKRNLSRGNVCYDFPLLQKDMPPMLLRVVLHSLDPPSLSFVSDAIADPLECLSRQILLDTSLTSRLAVSPENMLGLNLAAGINNAGLTGEFSRDVQQLLDVCRKTARCWSVSAVITGKDLVMSSVADDATARFLETLGKKLSAVQEKKRRPMSVNLKAPDGRDYIATCAPIMRDHRTIDGLVMIVDVERKSGYSSAVRTLSAKIASICEDKQSANALVDRISLIAQVDKSITAQPTLTHSLVYFDTDKMHTINDAFGYEAGDRTLKRIGQILWDCAGANDTVSHLGSDRFALFMPGATVDTALAKANQILRFISQESVEDENKAIGLSASAGISCTGADSANGEELLTIAEVTSRGAQDRGGNQSASYEDVDNSIIQRRSDVDKVGFLQTALLENQFTLHAQRIEAINTTPTQKFELLARLTDQRIDNGSAHQFLMAAERYQMMTALDRWVVNSALASLAGAENTLEVNLATFCINVSAQSLQDDSFVDHIEARIADTGIPPDILCFEITETSLVRHIDTAQRFIQRIQRLGCKIALDDFGTGYSSFAYLKTLPANILKIDGTFVRDLLECPLSNTIVSSVVQIGETIGAQTVAEHVENELVRSRLKDLGVHYVQGFAIHRPEPLDDVLSNFDNPTGHDSDIFESVDLRSDTLELMVSGRKS